ncbi:uL15 family ribosomal protein [Candidatus Woesearchaeota archaeon]|nr:uL15 family ribosomal protein [Candidatus Woesearchaeota archaeon]
MAVNKRKKNTRMRGSQTHGWGAKKKHRGAGNRGGRGMAGSGKRADQKKPSILKEFGNKYFGKHGFTRPQKTIKKDSVVHLYFLEENAEKIAKKENGFYNINLNELGYTKLLGTGEITKKYKIICKKISKKAQEKIKRLNGEVINANN